MAKTIGILAHVDAGKTTLTEQILYHAHAISKRGRVDHGSAFMDSDPLERQRGITIFSGQARIELSGNTYYLLDTPGHADFAAEMERSVQVMDAALLVISCVEGIQAHTRTVWKLIRRYNIPVVIFINKLDRVNADRAALIADIKTELSSDILDLENGFSDEQVTEAIAERDETLLEKYLAGEYDETLWLDAARKLFVRRAIFPVMSGSALKDEGVTALLDMLTMLMPAPDEHSSGEFSAKVYKINNTAKYGRLANMRVMSGTLSVRDRITLPGDDDTPYKVSAMYETQGGSFTPIASASAGMLCAVQGIPCKAGTVIGAQTCSAQPELKPILMAQVLFAPPLTYSKVLEALRVLEDEDPQLQVEYHEDTTDIDVHIMGAIQLEVLQTLMKARFNMDISFGPSRISYMETISDRAIGVGHYEPLRHYAETQLLLEPGERGSGITFESRCHVDKLTRPYQNQIRRAVLARPHRGVLTGAPLTDVHVILREGRSHLKHTEDEDFYEATARAVRNGLMYAESVLLEPVCEFELYAPLSEQERVLRDIQINNGELTNMTRHPTRFEAIGTMPASTLAPYMADFPALTHGQGGISQHLSHYAPCHNAAEVIERAKYNPLADLGNPPGSVFCAKGAGYNVMWDSVRELAHIPIEPIDC